MRGLILALVSVLVIGCGPSTSQHELRLWSKSYAFSILPDPSPPHAREPIMYKVVVRDRESRQPIESGEGRIFANDSLGAHTWDGFSKGPEPGTYYGKLSYVAAGLWAVAIQFRRDSLHGLERVDWMQDVFNERPSSTP